MSKRRQSGYASGASRWWVKVKCPHWKLANSERWRVFEKPGGDVMKPIASVEEGVRLIESFKGLPQEFQLAVPDTMLDDVGINMAVITDHVLKRGREPDGFTQASGYRVYRYKALKCN